MSSFISSFFKPNVEENIKSRIVKISGIKTKYLFKDIENVWNTSVISKYMFYNVSGSSFQIYSFFIPDLYFTLEKLLDRKTRGHFYSQVSVIKEIMAQLKSNTWYGDYFKEITKTLDYSQLEKLTYTLLPIQMGALKAYDEKVLALHLKGYLLAADVGTGKSVLGIALAACLHANPVIIICPKYIIDSVWIDAINVQFKGSKSYWASNDKNNIPIKGKDFYIFHYEAIGNAVDFFRKYKLDNPVIILDESHNLNDVNSQRTQAYLELCEITNSQNIIHESGTAIKNLGTEAIPLFRAIDEFFTPRVEDAFRSIYKRSANRALEILNNRLGMVSHKISKSSVMGDSKPIRKQLLVKLPNAERYTLDYIRNELADFITSREKFYAPQLPHHEAVYLEAIGFYQRTIKSKEERDKFTLYQQYIKTMRTGYNNMTMGDLSKYCNTFEKGYIIPKLPNDLKKKFNESKVFYKYLSLKIMGEFLGGVLGRRRAELHSELIAYSGIDEIVNNSEKKTICFTNYVDTLLTAKKYFEDRDFDPIVIYTETNKDVFKLLEDFKTNVSKNPLIATIKSLSTGVTVICANTVIFLNMPWRSFEYEQCLARVFRLGQDTQVYAYDIVLDTGDIANISTRMVDIMQLSADQVELIMGKGFDSYTVESINIDDVLNGIDKKMVISSVFDF